jgi:hypothetical protein
MNSEKFREHLRKQPFQAFRLFMSDGASYEVVHPEFALVAQREIAVALPPRTGDMPERFVYLDPLHIVRLEPIEEEKSKPRKNGRRRSE